VVGDTGRGGGTVFYVDEGAAAGSRYMEVVVAGMTPAWDETNAGSFYPWCVGPGATTDVATDSAIGSGATNTTNMVEACTSGAANSARAYTGGGLTAGSWSLPSKDELEKLEISGVGELTASSYWSSSQYSDNTVDAWAQRLDVQKVGDKITPISVRPIRAF
jgi:hypothetical protein